MITYDILCIAMDLLVVCIYIYITLFHQKLVDNKKMREKTLK